METKNQEMTDTSEEIVEAFLEGFIEGILNEPGITWKTRRALLRGLKLSEESIRELVPEPKGDFHASDY